MPQVDVYRIPKELTLGIECKGRVPWEDQQRQRAEAKVILRHLRHQPGAVLADEVGMGKTFVALAVAYSIATQSRRGPVIIMVPANLIDKWVQDLKTFCELYLENRSPVLRDDATPKELRDPSTLRYGIARRAVELLKLLDDEARERCHLIFLTQGSMGRQQNDKWVRLALIRETLRRHGRGQAHRLIKVKRHIHRFMAELLRAFGEQRASDWGDELWCNLLQSDPREWMERYNESLDNDHLRLTDDPVPEAVLKVLPKIDLRPMAAVLAKMPIRARGGSGRIKERIASVRPLFREVVQDLWKQVLVRSRWRSPLLIMDEAHHLKNPATSLARQFLSPESDTDLKTGDGAMARKFDRMLFLTATPFQLGHHELVRVLERFGDIRWQRTELGSREDFRQRLAMLEASLTESQRMAIRLQQLWSRLQPDERPQDDDPDAWWDSLQGAAAGQLTPRQRSLVDAYNQACQAKHEAEDRLRRWVVRHNKGELWPGTQIARRRRIVGAAVAGNGSPREGLPVPPAQLLPFFLAARSAVHPRKDLLGDALCSSYEAFRFTRRCRQAERDDLDEQETQVDSSHSTWYLRQFDNALKRVSGGVHPKVAKTVEKAVDLWEDGEKVLIFAFYRQTCRALRLHISQMIEQRRISHARRRFAGAGRPIEDEQVRRVLKSIQRRYFDDARSPARNSLDRALRAILARRQEDLMDADLPPARQERLVDVMRRFLRVETTLVRCFPIHRHDTQEPDLAIHSMLETKDASGVSWRDKFEGFIDFLVDRCSEAERENYLDAVEEINTGRIRVMVENLSSDEGGGTKSQMVLSNVQEATGKTRRDHRSRLMRAFNTPFFPDILVCSQVMGEGVDLQQYCCHVIHHDLAWNPSTIEQRTGRVDRLGCKAEPKGDLKPGQPIHIYLPYIAGAFDERQFHIMSDREQWFRIVMGQDEVAKLIPDDDDREQRQLPEAFTQQLTFNLGIRTG